MKLKHGAYLSKGNVVSDLSIAWGLAVLVTGFCDSPIATAKQVIAIEGMPTFALKANRQPRWDSRALRARLPVLVPAHLEAAQSCLRRQ